ncbi:SRPBCC family protein [Streptomyces sp. NPDC057499]|uniref:SRPBCC family protein n=1 Tax=Streptomyces sp. NPDC057499 TaxID=3346150 RepID=UPI0036B0C4BA
MASTTISRTVPASPDKVWALIGGFHALPDWLPYVPQSTVLDGGRVRRLEDPENAGGIVIVERLVSFNDAERQLSYVIVESPFPVDDYIATLRVHSVPGRDDVAEVQWSGRFNPLNATEEEAIDVFNKIYSDGLEALHETLLAA